ALVVGEVPVEDVVLGVGQGVDDAADDGEGLVVAGGVHQHPAVRPARLIADGPGGGGNEVGLRGEVEVNQLTQRLQPLQSPPVGLGLEEDDRRRLTLGGGGD